MIREISFLDNMVEKENPGFGRVSTRGTNDPTILEGVDSYSNNYEGGFGEVMT